MSTANQDNGNRADGYEVMILITRGDPMPKKNYEKKLHPTYEVSIKIKLGDKKIATPHKVVKFFDQYRALYEDLLNHKIGPGKDVVISAEFPPSHASSKLGIKLTEDQLQDRCFKLNKWMQALFTKFHDFSPEAQKCVSDFLSLHDDDEAMEANKDYILQLLANNAASKSQEVSNKTNEVASPNEETDEVIPVRTAKLTAANLEEANRLADNSNTSASTNTATPNGTPVKGVERKNSSHSIKNTAPLPAPMLKSGSVLSTAEGRELTTKELADYAQETLVNHCLAVSVLRGDKYNNGSTASAGATGAHHAMYEAIIRFLPFTETDYHTTNGDDAVYDEEEYQELISQLPAVTVSKVFDGFRALKNNLQEIGVFTRNESNLVNKMREFNERDTSRYLAVSVDADFPPTYRRSSLGLGLTDYQLQARVVLLNYWMGNLLKDYHKLPRGGQELLLEFFGLHTISTNNAAVSNDNDENNANNIDLRELYIAALMNSFTPPLQTNDTDKDNASNKKQTKYSSILGSLFHKHPKETSSSTNHIDKTDVNQDYDSDNHNNNNTGGNNTRASETTTIMDVNEVHVDISTLTSIAKETIVFDFVGVLVTAGDKVEKKGTFTNSLHQGYETTIRVLPFEKVTFPTKEKIDPVEYSKHFDHPSISITKSFDAYRALKAVMEGHNVVCMNSPTNGNNNNAVVLEASFPRTFRRSSIGVGLSEQNLIERQAMLNHYMGTLLKHYTKLSPQAQEEVLNFFLIDDNPSEPQNFLILSMLKQTYTPPLLPPPKPVVVDNKKDDKKKKNKKDKKPKKKSDSTAMVQGSNIDGNVEEESVGDENESNSSHGGDHPQQVAGNDCCVPGGACIIS